MRYSHLGGGAFGSGGGGGRSGGGGGGIGKNAVSRCAGCGLSVAVNPGSISASLGRAVAGGGVGTKAVVVEVEMVEVTVLAGMAALAGRAVIVAKMAAKLSRKSSLFILRAPISRASILTHIIINASTGDSTP